MVLAASTVIPDDLAEIVDGGGESRTAAGRGIDEIGIAPAAVQEAMELEIQAVGASGVIHPDDLARIVDPERIGAEVARRIADGSEDATAVKEAGAKAGEAVGGEV